VKQRKNTTLQVENSDEGLLKLVVVLFRVDELEKKSGSIIFILDDCITVE